MKCENCKRLKEQIENMRKQTTLRAEIEAILNISFTDEDFSDFMDEVYFEFIPQAVEEAYNEYKERKEND